MRVGRVDLESSEGFFSEELATLLLNSVERRVDVFGLQRVKAVFNLLVVLVVVVICQCRRVFDFGEGFVGEDRRKERR